jgi:hypothetical protein
MPEISRFFGIIITMYFGDHAPPHFHAQYGKSKATIGINDLTVGVGSLPPRALGLVMEWAAKHQGELMRNWNLVQSSQNPQNIQGLE